MESSRLLTCHTSLQMLAAAFETVSGFSAKATCSSSYDMMLFECHDVRSGPRVYSLLTEVKIRPEQAPGRSPIYHGVQLLQIVLHRCPASVFTEARARRVWGTLWEGRTRRLGAARNTCPKKNFQLHMNDSRTPRAERADVICIFKESQSTAYLRRLAG